MCISTCFMYSEHTNFSLLLFLGCTICDFFHVVAIFFRYVYWKKSTCKWTWTVQRSLYSLFSCVCVSCSDAISFSRKIFPTQESNLDFLYYRQIVDHLNHQGSPRLLSEESLHEKNLNRHLTLKTHHFISVLWHFIITCSSVVICVYCTCMVETPYKGIAILSWFHIQWCHASCLKLAMIEVSTPKKSINTTNPILIYCVIHLNLRKRGRKC